MCVVFWVGLAFPNSRPAGRFARIASTKCGMCRQCERPTSLLSSPITSSTNIVHNSAAGWCEEAQHPNEHSPTLFHPNPQHIHAEWMWVSLLPSSISLHEIFKYLFNVKLASTIRIRLQKWETHCYQPWLVPL